MKHRKNPEMMETLSIELMETEDDGWALVKELLDEVKKLNPADRGREPTR
jgi:hypothetical protein